MTNKEILAELKISYENLRDIRENGCIDHCNGQMKDNIDKLLELFDSLKEKEHSILKYRLSDLFKEYNPKEFLSKH